MQPAVAAPRAGIASIVFSLLDPIPYGFFVAALIFDVIYDRSAEVLWFKAAAWLISIGLVFAILPRLINLKRVWLPNGQPRLAGEAASFWFNLVAIVAAIVNAFVHSRDAYGVMPDGMWLSVATVVMLALAKVALPLQPVDASAAS